LSGPFKYRRKLYRYCIALSLYCMALYRYRQISFITKWYEATLMIRLDLDSRSRLSIPTLKQFRPNRQSPSVKKSIQPPLCSRVTVR
jgi:hypothetical protein